MIASAGIYCSDSEPVEHRFTIEVHDGKPVDGINTLKVKAGDTVFIWYDTDTVANFHISGYDIETEVPAGRPRIERFVAQMPGRFEIQLLELDETVAILEVKPR